jgi:hypothetical protein
MNSVTVGVHKRYFGRDKIIYDPWHYLAVLERKPGALRNGAPFRQWDLPEAMSEVRILLEERSDGDRQFVGILTVVGRYGLEPVASACMQALAEKTVSSDVILAILSKRHDEQPLAPVQLSAQLPLLTVVPVADCKRYDRLMKGGVYGTIRGQQNDNSSSGSGYAPL